MLTELVSLFVDCFFWVIYVMTLVSVIWHHKAVLTERKWEGRRR